MSRSSPLNSGRSIWISACPLESSGSAACHSATGLNRLALMGFNRRRSPSSPSPPGAGAPSTCSSVTGISSLYRSNGVTPSARGARNVFAGSGVSNAVSMQIASSTAITVTRPCAGRPSSSRTVTVPESRACGRAEAGAASATCKPWPGRSTGSARTPIARCALQTASACAGRINVSVQ